MFLFTLDLKNEPGELAYVGESLGQRDINVELGAVTLGDHGLVSLTASDEDAARAALMEASLPYTEHPALQIKCADRPGELGRIGRLLADAGINIEGLVPVSICQGEAVFAAAFDKMDDARRVLGDLVID
ncbi:ACT domain-containing protein [Phytohabitans rumicis]|uniref:ACT domain-containing protein n=1 Tax=Phytohabitans rumicis TaxID=1076125 RepID=A0A6V8KZY5_9ACTN|nr:ACT domain-containing protein [Phytohabitans rumicis]GFJ87889.1 hypothetical protein Prum_015310 [Phytohabitans rumicis]